MSRAPARVARRADPQYAGHALHAEWTKARTAGGTIWLYTYVPKGFLPRQDIGTMSGFIDAPAGTSAEAMKSHITALIAIVQQDPAVATVTAYLNGDNAGSMFVNLKDRSEREYWARRVRMKGGVAE